MMNRRQFLYLAGSAFSRADDARYKVGDQVMVFFPSPDIQHDAFILGIVKGRLADGRYRITVTDYVEGHDYGLSCEPLPPEDTLQNESPYGKGWEAWDDTRRLHRDSDYAVPADKLLPAARGRMYAISRNNVWTTFARWLSDAPVLYVDKLEQARDEAQKLGLKDMTTAFDLAIAHRRAFYSPEGAPYWPWQVVPHLVPLLDKALALLKKDARLRKYFYAKKRDWKAIRKSGYLLFTLEALDKIKHDALDELYEDGMDKVDPKVMQAVRQRLKALGARLPQ